MDGYLDIYDLRQLNRAEMSNMNRLITFNEIEAVI